MTLLITTKYTTKSSKTTSGKTVSNKKAHSMSGFNFVLAISLPSYETIVVEKDKRLLYDSIYSSFIHLNLI